MNNICAVIPAYNEEKKLEGILKRLKAKGINTIVVDDGSSDNTREIAEAHSTHTISHPANTGKGNALRDGFRVALEKEYDLIVTLDADGQHNPDEVPLFIEKINSGSAGIVIGNRLNHPKNMPPSRFFVNNFFSKIISRVCKQNIPDALCGYRIIKKDILKSIRLNSDRFDIDPEIPIKSAKAGFIIDSIDIECIYADESSHINSLRDGKNFFLLILKELRSR